MNWIRFVKTVADHRVGEIVLMNVADASRLVDCGVVVPVDEPEECRFDMHDALRQAVAKGIKMATEELQLSVPARSRRREAEPETTPTPKVAKWLPAAWRECAERCK